MTKNDFIAWVASELNTSSAEAGKSLEAVIASFKKLFEAKESLVLQGFASLGVKERAARDGRNPKTGEALKISASSVPYFKMSSQLKALLNTPARKATPSVVKTKPKKKA